MFALFLETVPGAGGARRVFSVTIRNLDFGLANLNFVSSSVAKLE